MVPKLMRPLLPQESPAGVTSVSRRCLLVVTPLRTPVAGEATQAVHRQEREQEREQQEGGREG